VKLKRVDLKEAGFTSVALVIDEDVKDKLGQVVALVLYHPGGNIIYMHRGGYDPMEIMIAGEKYFCETIHANRYKIFKVKPVKEEEIAKGEKNEDSR